MKQAEMNSFGGQEGMYDCHYEWPDNCSVQGGSGGVVFTKNGAYETAFFEAFPKEPKTFIRGEGKSVEEAEKSAWEQYQKIVNCATHEFERRGYTDGTGFCKHCDFQDSNAFEPQQYCKICNSPTNWRSSKKKEWYCKQHEDLIPEEDQYSWQKKDASSKDILAMLFGGE
jgi:hypothetical protein